MKVTETLNTLTSLFHVSRDTCTMHGRDIKTRYFGLILILESNAIILRGTLPAHCILKVERLKTGEKLYEIRYLSPRPPPKISLKHDHNWTKRMINWVLQLNISQLENSFNSHLEKHFKLDLSSQPNPNLIQLVIERGNLWRKKTRPVHERLWVNGCKENLVLQIERGNL